MFSRSSRKRLSSRSVSVPHQSGPDLRVPLGRRERPCPVSLCPAAAHLWPQLTGLGRIERGQPCNACGDQCPGFALHKWSHIGHLTGLQTQQAYCHVMVLALAGTSLRTGFPRCPQGLESTDFLQTMRD
ncbi:uncharacterized protein LOC120593716 isoform X2 [Pteropus medius]|uniref:prickle-like protein 2 isoform X2 n=1 Tax=Pteropus vampyrus TaxID=132908 RepID=UPI00196B03B9|nr:prickle-like protein 2 isoform X2 [Pteropus giganteus]